VEQLKELWLLLVGGTPLRLAPATLPQIIDLADNVLFWLKLLLITPKQCDQIG